VRLFFALWPPAATAEALHAWARKAQRNTGGRVTRAETIHLTLAFLGETPPERLDAAIAAARRVRAPRGTLPIERAKWWKHNRIVWVGPEKTDASLHEALAAELRAEGFALEKRAFAAHVTLIRKAGEGELPSVPRVEWPVEGFVLVRSALSAEGPAYERVAEFGLGEVGGVNSTARKC